MFLRDQPAQPAQPSTGWEAADFLSLILCSAFPSVFDNDSGLLWGACQSLPLSAGAVSDVPSGEQQQKASLSGFELPKLCAHTQYNCRHLEVWRASKDVPAKPGRA